jgi:drug/metabolite transporter (DMT)-like permease
MQGYLFIILAGLILSTNSLFVKLSGNAVPGPSLVFYRCLIATITLFIIAPFFDKTTFKVTRKDINQYLLLSLFFVTGIVCATTAFQMTSIQLAIAMINISPFIVLIAAFFFLKERITKEKIIALLIAFVGVLIINPLTKISLSGEGLGALLALVTAFTSAGFAVLTRKIQADHAMGSTFWLFLFGMLLTFPMPFLFGWGDPLAIIPQLLWMGIITGALAYVFYDIGMHSVEAGKTALILLVVIPLAAIVWSLLILGENPDPSTILGAFFLVMGGLYLQLNSRIHLHLFNLLHRKKGIEEKKKN